MARAQPADAPEGLARRYAQHLLRQLGVAPLRPLTLSAEHPASAWARSGLMALTGRADGAPQLCPAPLAATADGALAALASLTPDGALDHLSGSALCAERAALAGHARAGARSAGGSCCLLQAADGWLALNLARDEDWSLVEAWLESPAADWEAIARHLRSASVPFLVERGRELGLALAACDLPPRRARALLPRLGDAPAAPPTAAPLVVDLSSLWAGPLCSHLLQMLGAQVIKVESRARPDGARFGPAAFFDLLNGGKRCVALDFGSAAGRAQLAALVRRADIVIEGSRPRALRQLGIEAEALLRERPRLTWVSLTGHGRDPPQDGWIAYGDDAGIAAGLGALMLEACGEPLFCGDAIADPLTGLHAALAAYAAHRAGGGRLIALSLVEVTREALGFELPPDASSRRAQLRAWRAVLGDAPAAAPRARAATRPAGGLGQDTAAVLAELGIPC